MSKNYWHLLFSLKLLIIFSSCHTRQDESISAEPVFRSLPSSETGIDFANHIRENQRFNFMTYPYIYNGGGVAVGDLDNDGLADIYFTGNMEGDRLYHNHGSLKFEDITRQAGILKQNLWTTGVTMADVNNDGLMDIYVCRSGDRGFRNNLLYINQGDMRFEELAREWGVNDNGYSTQATFLDYDLDGDLDLYLVNHATKFNFNQEEIFKNKLNPAPEEADQLYRNEGDHFTKVSQEAGIRHFAFGLSATVSDLNADGYPDIYACSDFFEPDFLYINQQDGTFRDVLQESTQHISFSSMGADIADFNNDGLPDILVADMRAPDHERFHTNMVGMNRHKFARMLTEDYHYQYMQNTLQLNRGTDSRGLPVFSEVGQMAGISSTDWSWSTLFFDMDNDGWKDLFISNGIARDIQQRDAWTKINESRQQQLTFTEMLEMFPKAPLQNYSFINTQKLGFRDVSASFGIDYQGASNGAAYADLDNDGDLDLLVNNLNDTASVYENTTAQRSTVNYLQIRLRGRKDNHFGVGAKVNIYYSDQQQYQELTMSRGFQSSVPPLLHFGLDSISRIDRLVVHWPNGQQQLLEQLDANQILTLDQRDSYPGKDITSMPEVGPILKKKQTNIIHQEDEFDDFSREPLLPFKQSSHGPVIAVGDVNGDRLEDFYYGGSKGYSGSLYLQEPTGSLIEQEIQEWQQDQNYEDTDALFLDVEGDGDLDLFVASGSTEQVDGSPYLQDRLYLNDGQGHFSSSTLPELLINTSCLAATDFDKDGDIDVFVGGASLAGSYPQSVPSYLFINEDGRFRKQEVFTGHIVQDAAWVDYDQDMDQDLILVGHWMAPQIMENDGGTLLAAQDLVVQSVQTEGLAGWWNCIVPADLDQDGKIDLVLGNEGLNTRFAASPGAPLEILAADYDQNGSQEALLFYQQDGQSLPVYGRDKILGRLPGWQRKFPDYQSFVEMNIRQMLNSNQNYSLLHLQVDQLASCVLYNKGQGNYSLQKLPEEAQFSAVRAIKVVDLNADGRDDLILAGNRHDWEVESSRSDAGIGLLLLSDGKRGFQPLSLSQSGFFADGEVMDMELLKSVQQSNLILVGRNQDSLQVYRLPDPQENLASVE